MAFSILPRSVLKTILVAGVSCTVFASVRAEQPIEKNSDKALTVEDCRKMGDRVARLECFDTVFNVSLPKPPPSPPIFAVPPKVVVKRGPIQSIAQQQEETRSDLQKGWITRFRPWSMNDFFTADSFREIRGSSTNKEAEGTANRHEWTEQNTDVFLTQQEADVSAESAGKSLSEKALLMASCENNITTLYVVLPKPVDDPRTRVTLSSDRGLELHVKWRDVEQGKVISAGRGLESIDFLKSLASFKRVQLQLHDDQEERAFVFDIEDLSARLIPLRTACHW